MLYNFYEYIRGNRYIELLSIPKLHPPLKNYFRIFAILFSLLELHVYI